MKRALVGFLMFLGFLAGVYGQASSTSPSYRHAVTWNYWDGDSWEAWEKLDVRLDGKSIGTPFVAFKALAKLPVRRGDFIRLDLPANAPAASQRRQAHFISSFMQRWLKAGAVIELFQSGKKLNVHWVTWADFFNKSGNYLKSLDEATWIADGERIGKVDALLKKIDLWLKQPEVVIQVLEPLHFRSDSTDTPARGRAFDRLESLVTTGPAVVFFVNPMEEDMFVGEEW